MISKSDFSSERKPSRIERDQKDLKKLIRQIEDSRNTFEISVETEESKQQLSNINTVKSASDVVRKSLLNIPEDGKNMHKHFIQNCTTDPD